jgi:colicin import membrane protein
MANISGWEKFRKAVTGSYSEKTELALAQERAAEKAAAIAIEKAKAEAAAKKKAAEEAASKAESARVAKVKADAERMAKNAAPKKTSAGTGKTTSVTPTKKAPAKKLPKDGDGDGKIFDGTPQERPAPKKKTAPKKSSK